MAFLSMHSFAMLALARPSEPQQRVLQEPGGGACDATVAYVFLTQRDLPLASAWRVYLDSCPAGSHVVHVLASDGAPTSDGAAPYPALPEARIVNHSYPGVNIRCRLETIDAMARLWDASATTRAPNGCVPRWTHLLSDSCAPHVSCASFHRSLAANTGVSLLRGGRDSKLGGHPPNRSDFSDPRLHDTGVDPQCVLKASQWSTLWMPHAETLVRSAGPYIRAYNAATRQGFVHRMGCPDEFYTAWQLHSHRLSFSHGHGPTTVDWEHGEDGGHPARAMCTAANETAADESAAAGARPHGAEDVWGAPSSDAQLRALLDRARQEGTAFVRKVDASCAAPLERAVRAVVSDDDDMRREFVPPGCM